MTHIKVYLRHKRKRGMKLKKDLSFKFFKVYPFLRLTFSTWRPTGDSTMNQWTSYPKAMSINFKLISTWRPRLKVMIYFTNQQFKHLSERDVSKKSDIDTTIDFVKHPKYSRINTFLNTIPKHNLEWGNHNARCSNDRTRRETQDKMSCLILRFSRK